MQNTIKVPRSVISISVCSDRFPHQCLKGIIRVNWAVIFELAVFLLLSLFWTNRFITTITTTNISPNNRFRPTAFPSPQPHPPLDKPRHPRPFTHNRQHRLTFISANAAIFAPAAARSDRTASLQADAGVCSPCRVFGSRGR